jgi:hypothetical protein
MSLYKHVVNKDGILNGIVNPGVTETDVPGQGAEPKIAHAAACDLSPPGPRAPPLGGHADHTALLPKYEFSSG